MTIYNILRIIVLCYPVAIVLFAIVMAPSYNGRAYEINKALVIFFRALASIFLFAWLALALPWMDIFIAEHFTGIQLITKTNFFNMETWFGKHCDGEIYRYNQTVWWGIWGFIGFIFNSFIETKETHKSTESK